MKNLEDILFGCAVCFNGPVVNKIIQEPFIVTLNSKTKDKIFDPPLPDLWKTIKIEVDPKIGHEFWRFVSNFDEVPSNP